MSEVIRFLNQIFQSDSLSVLLFVLALNPLSFMLKKEKGYLIEFVGPINKDRILKECTNRVRKIWSSELWDYNKVTAYDSFAILIITQSVGVINQKSDEIKQIDIKTRKILTMAGNFHPNSDTDKLYVNRKPGARVKSDAE